MSSTARTLDPRSSQSQADRPGRDRSTLRLAPPQPSRPGAVRVVRTNGKSEEVMVDRRQLAALLCARAW